MNLDEKLIVAEVMCEYGGGFIQALSECWFRADLTNKNRLEAAFADYFEEYKKLYLRMKKSHLKGVKKHG
jgi:hypothetical protein